VLLRKQTKPRLTHSTSQNASLPLLLCCSSVSKVHTTDQCCSFYCSSIQPTQPTNEPFRVNASAVGVFPSFARPYNLPAHPFTTSTKMERYANQCDGFCCWQCVRTQEVAVVEDLGQFKRLLPPGLHCVIWPLQGIVGKVSSRECLGAFRYGCQSSHGMELLVFRERVLFFPCVVFTFGDCG